MNVFATTALPGARIACALRDVVRIEGIEQHEVVLHARTLLPLDERTPVLDEDLRVRIATQAEIRLGDANDRRVELGHVDPRNPIERLQRTRNRGAAEPDHQHARRLRPGDKPDHHRARVWHPQSERIIELQAALHRMRARELQATPPPAFDDVDLLVLRPLVVQHFRGGLPAFAAAEYRQRKSETQEQRRKTH